MTDKELEYRTASQCISSDYCRGWNAATMEAEKLIAIKNAEIERLKELRPVVLQADVTEELIRSMARKAVLQVVDTDVERIKAEARAEFAERLQSRCEKQQGCLYASDIGAELDEMEGDDDDND